MLGTIAATLVLAGGYRAAKGVVALTNLEQIYTGKVVWVTGASQGLGEALALAYARAGAKLILSARSEDKLVAVAAACTRTSPTKDPTNVLVLPVDLADSAEALHAVGGKAQAAFGGQGVDMLVNNGGVGSRSAAIDTELQTDGRVMAINFTAPVALTKAVLPGMLAKGGAGDGAGACPRIVVISSVQGKFGLPFRSSYSASKHALHGYFDSLRVGTRPDPLAGVHVLFVRAYTCFPLLPCWGVDVCRCF
jgi:short-subunit dehydrogenase